MVTWSPDPVRGTERVFIGMNVVWRNVLEMLLQIKWQNIWSNYFQKLSKRKKKDAAIYIKS